MAYKIATEGYAANIGGGSNYTSNKGCTRTRAYALGCKVYGTSTESLQLVREIDLSKSTGGGSGSSGTSDNYLYLYKYGYLTQGHELRVSVKSGCTANFYFSYNNAYGGYIFGPITISAGAYNVLFAFRIESNSSCSSYIYVDTYKAIVQYSGSTYTTRTQLQGSASQGKSAMQNKISWYYI